MYKKIFLGFSVLFLLVGMVLLSGQPEAHAATVNAASCSPADVQAAVNAAAIGDTVMLPACNYTNWNTTVTINKRITLRGQGTTQTIIQRAAVAASFETIELVASFRHRRTPAY